MPWTLVVFSIGGGALATYLVARSMNRRQPKKVEPPPEPAPPKIEVDVFIRSADFFSLSSGLVSCGCDECISADLEFAAMKEEFMKRMEQFDASRSASTEVDPRKLEYVRYLVQTGRLSDYL